jgi:EmrB/QacA subfamily drug resistance transporter
VTDRSRLSRAEAAPARPDPVPSRAEGAAPVQAEGTAPGPVEGTASNGEREYRPDPRRWRALWVTLAAGFMGLLDVSIVAVALPSIERSLGTSTSGVQWVVSGYTLAFGLALVPGGRLGDAWGRRRMFLLSLAGFVLTSALCGAAPSLLTLNLARLAQGFAAGLLGPQNSGLIQDLFRGAERGKAFGMFGATVGLSTAVGPIVGGVILAVFGEPEGWRWIFYVNVPIGLAALVLASRLLPGRTAEQRADRTPARHRLDPVGSALLGAGVLALMFPLLEYARFGELWWLLVVGTVLLVAFGRWEARVVRVGRRPPLLEPRLLTSTPVYASGATLGLAYFVGFSGIFIVLAVFFQFGLGYSPLASGLAVTSFSVGSAVSAWAAGTVVVRWGRRVTVAGLCLVVVGLVAAAFVLRAATGPTAGLLTAAPLALAGAGSGMVITPNITLTLAEVPVRMAGAAGGALQTGQRIGSAVGIALLAGVYYTVQDVARAGPGTAIFVTLLCAVGFIVVALALAVAELVRTRDRTSSTVVTGSRR